MDCTTIWGEEIKKNTNECVKVIEETIFEKELELKADYFEVDEDEEDGKI